MRELSLENTHINMVNESEFTSRKMYEYKTTFGSFTLSRGMYNNLKDMISNVERDYQVEPKSAFLEFLRDMDSLNMDIDGQVPEVPLNAEETEAMRFINNYLGELGVTIEYPIAKDRVYLSKFMNADYRSFFEEMEKRRGH